MHKKPSILAIILVLNIAIGSAMADPNLVGWWKFDEATGSSAVDSSGNGYNGTITGAIRLAGKEGTALDFEGADYVTIPPAVFSTIQKQISIFLWQYGDSTLPVANSIFYGVNSSNYRVLNAHIPWSSGAIIFDGGHSGTTDVYDRITKPSESASQYKGQWNNWIFTKNTDTGQMKAYLNGQLWNSAEGKTKLISGITQFKIGAKTDGTSNYPGMIDEFKIYNRELSEVEIKRMLGLQVHCDVTGYDLNGDCDVNFADVEELSKIWLLGDQMVEAIEPDNSHLQASYMFDEQSGTIAYDSSGHNRDAVVEANDSNNIWTAGKAGNCINLNGTFGIEVPSSVFSNISNAMTIAADVNTASEIVNSVDFSAGGTDPNLWDKVSWQNEDSNNGAGWVHYAFVKDAGSSLMRIYRNGLIVASSVEASELINGAEAGTSYIGVSCEGDDFFAGMLDNFCIYNYALTQAEIVYLAQGSDGEVLQPMQPFIVQFDPHEDGIINYIDFSMLAQKWLEKVN